MIYLYLIVAAAAALLVWRTVHNIRHGSDCCGEHEPPPARIRPADRNISHYQYRYRIGIEGMVCGKCARRAENAFNSAEDIYAKVDLESRSAMIYSKRLLQKQETAGIISKTGFVQTSFEEKSE